MDIEVIVRKKFPLLISHKLLGPSQCLCIGLQFQDHGVEILELYDLLTLHKLQITNEIKLNQIKLNEYIHTNILCSQIAWLIEVGRGTHIVMCN